MSEEKKELFNWQSLLFSLIIVLVSAAVVGGTVWYFMNQNDEAQQKSYSDSVSSLQKQIDSLGGGASVTPTPTPAPAAKDSIEELKTFCQANGSPKDGTVSYMENANGIYANCSLDNAMLIGTKVSAVWTKIWAGNGTISDTLCDQYKIPSKMSGGTCKY